MTRVVGIADLHGNLPDDLPEGDVLVVGGDICPISDHVVAFQARWLVDVFYPWIEGLPHQEVIWVAGNHDFVCEPSEWKPGGRGHYLRDSGIEVAGLRFHGTPWVPHLPGWAFHKSHEELAAIVAAIPQVDVLISHGPPFGTGDRLVRGGHAGSTALRDRLEEVPPQLCLFGHIHEDHGSWLRGETGDTTLANVAHVDERYRLRPGAAQVFEVEAATGAR